MKAKTRFVCQGCGNSSPKWLGRCPGCGEWNSLVEEKTTPIAKESDLSLIRDEFRQSRQKALDQNGIHGNWSGENSPWEPLEKELATDQPFTDQRWGTGLDELDRVLGGGLVSDSFILLGGDPGIGKSTLLLQLASGLCQSDPQAKILYVSGEESLDQIRRRSKRLSVQNQGQIFLAAETQLEKVFATVKELQPDVVMMDSLQTFSSGALESAPGSVSQVREVAARLMTLAKSAGISVWLVGHVTKEGSIAGPKVVEHMVDTVLYFEGDSGQNYRLLRAVKNRFGNVRELGVFEMQSEGLVEVKNPSSLFLSDREEAIAGTAIAPSLEGTRPILVELQALVTQSPLAVPRRTAVGMESSRVGLLAAILEKHLELPVSQQDLFFNVAGGMRIAEPACDLAACAAIWSSFQNIALPVDWVFIGEVGLTGEIRRVPQLEARIEEAEKLGFKGAVVPQAGQNLKDSRLEIHRISRVAELAKIFS